jgi:hypothetical protein
MHPWHFWNELPGRSRAKWELSRTKTISSLDYKRRPLDGTFELYHSHSTPRLRHTHLDPNPSNITRPREHGKAPTHALFGERSVAALVQSAHGFPVGPAGSMEFMKHADRLWSSQRCERNGL